MGPIGRMGPIGYSYGRSGLQTSSGPNRRQPVRRSPSSIATPAGGRPRKRGALHNKGPGEGEDERKTALLDP